MDFLRDIRFPKLPRKVRVAGYTIAPTTLAMGGAGLWYLGSQGKLPAALQDLYNRIVGGSGFRKLTLSMVGIPERPVIVNNAGQQFRLQYDFEYRGLPIPPGQAWTPTLPKEQVRGVYVGHYIYPAGHPGLLNEWGQRHYVNLSLPFSPIWTHYSISTAYTFNPAGYHGGVLELWDASAILLVDDGKRTAVSKLYPGLFRVA